MERTTGREYLIVILLMLMWGVVGLNRIGIAYLFPILVPLFHMAYWQTGLLLSGTSVTWAFSSWLGGNLSDRWGRRRVYLPAMAFASVVGALMGATWNFLSLFVVRDLLGLGDGVGWSVGQATVSDVSSPQRRALNQGLYAGGYTVMGAGIGAIIVTQLAHSLGWQWVFAVIGIGGLIIVGLLRLWLPAGSTTASMHSGFSWKGQRELLGNRQMVLLVLANVLILTWLQGFAGFGALYLTKIGHYPLREAGFVLSTWGILGLAGQILLPLVSDWIGRKPVMIIAESINAVTMLWLALSIPTPGLAAVLLAVNGFCGWGMLPLAMATVLAESVKPEQVGAAIGTANFFGVLIGTTLMPIVLGVMADHWGLHAPIWTVGLCMVVLVPLLFGVRETAPRRLASAPGVIPHVKGEA